MRPQIGRADVVFDNGRHGRHQETLSGTDLNPTSLNGDRIPRAGKWPTRLHATYHATAIPSRHLHRARCLQQTHAQAGSGPRAQDFHSLSFSVKKRTPGARARKFRHRPWAIFGVARNSGLAHRPCTCPQSPSPTRPPCSFPPRSRWAMTRCRLKPPRRLATPIRARLTSRCSAWRRSCRMWLPNAIAPRLRSRMRSTRPCAG
ncbi:hypothetical protein Tchl_2866 [Thauera chlorobenzoica]|uniref:Uncharacterized protein n=1 Tax=Thauera chlorobenzoica TaxID=96773 RepID=A0A1L6FFK5_9RHOO|nr:hypothetical protein Tchl_2866 [Thauera chlorobenzoica]